MLPDDNTDMINFLQLPLFLLKGNATPCAAASCYGGGGGGSGGGAEGSSRECTICSLARAAAAPGRLRLRLL